MMKNNGVIRFWLAPEKPSLQDILKKSKIKYCVEIFMIEHNTFCVSNANAMKIGTGWEVLVSGSVTEKMQILTKGIDYSKYPRIIRQCERAS